MGMIRTIKNLYWAIKSVSGSEQNRFFNNTSPGQSQNFKNSKDYLNAYQLVQYVGNATSLISGDIGNLEWELVDKKGQEVKDLRIEALLTEPMRGMTFNAWVTRSVQHLLLDGNVFWLLDSTNLLAQSRGQFNELRLLNPALVDVHDREGEEIISTTSKNSSGLGFYRIDFNNSIVQVVPENICQVQLPNPHNLLRGMGKVQMNVSAMDAERMSAIFNNTFFGQGAKMDYAITPDKDMPFKEFKQYEKELRAKYQGQDNYSKLFITPPGSDIKTIQISQKDMEFVEQRKISRQDIYSFFNIPPIISGNVDLAQYDSSGEQAKIYYDVSLPRTYKLLEASLTKVVRQINPNVWFRFIPKDIIDTEMQSKVASAAFDRGAITGNEYRERVGMARDTDSPTLDIHWIQSTYIPTEFSSDPTAVVDVPAPAPAKSIESPETKVLETGDSIEVKATRGQLSLHNVASRSKLRSEKAFLKMTINFYEAMEKRVLAGIKGFWDLGTKQPSIDDAFNFDEEITQAKLAATAVFTSAITVAINDVNKTLGSTVDSSFSNPQVQLVVEKLKVRYADLTINSRRKDIRKIIQRGLDEGLSVSKIKSELQVYFKSLTGKDAWRATRIARTEASYAWDQGADLSYRDLDVQKIDVVGCDGAHGQWDCNLTGFELSRISTLNFHPNHTGTTVPNGI